MGGNRCGKKNLKTKKERRKRYIFEDERLMVEKKKKVGVYKPGGGVDALVEVVAAGKRARSFRREKKKDIAKAPSEQGGGKGERDDVPSASKRALITLRRKEGVRRRPRIKTLGRYVYRGPRKGEEREENKDCTVRRVNAPCRPMPKGERVGPGKHRSGFRAVRGREKRGHVPVGAKIKEEKGGPPGAFNKSAGRTKIRAP